MPRLLTLLAVVPAIAFVMFSVLPPSYKETYAWVDPISLNTPAPNGRSRRWFNMGHWEGTEDFSDANDQLARKLLEFANAPAGGSVLDVAHGSGESLLLHLASNPLPDRLDALASIPSDTARARSLVFSYKVNNTINTPVTFYTGSAVPQLGKVDDQSHPLNPMRGFLGHSAGRTGSATGDYEDGYEDEELEEESTALLSADVNPPTGSADVDSPTGYNLIYILDAIYHFPPSLHSFLSIAQKSLAPGGVIAYTDLLPPAAGLNPFVARILSAAFSVPLPNLTSYSRSLAEYKAGLESLGFGDIAVEDWSSAVWPGFAKNLRDRGGMWAYVGRIVDRAADGDGWKLLAVRARRAGQKEDRQ